jgi:hypothetical protein
MAGVAMLVPALSVRAHELKVVPEALALVVE